MAIDEPNADFLDLLLDLTGDLWMVVMTGACITGNTVRRMGEVSTRDLRNHGGDVVDRVERGERVVVTRRGRPVAELRPLGSPGLPVAELIRRRAHLPLVDPDSLRSDVDVAIDASL